MSLIECDKHTFPASLSLPQRCRNSGCLVLTFCFVYILCVFISLNLFSASHISRAFLGFCHLAEGLWRCLQCHIATPSSISHSPYQSSAGHSSPGLLSVGTQPLTSAGGCTLIWSTFSSILKAQLSGGRDLTSPSISFTLSAALSCYHVVVFLFHCSDVLCCS